jgi:hypothetical protein
VQVATTDRGRGLGPFTGRQLTVIVCVAVVMVMFPIGAFAVTGTSIFVTDHTTGKQARVTGAGQLVTTPAFLKDLRTGPPTAAAGTCKPIATPTGGAALIVTSVNVAWSGMTPGTDFLDVWSDSACDTPIAFVQVATASGTMSIPLGAGVAIHAGQSLSATGFGPHPTGWVINAPGYVVPGSAV